MSIYTAPAAIDALVAACRIALPDTRVTDGQPITDELEVLAIGYTGEPTEPAVETTLAREQVALSPDRERYTINCLAWSVKGNASIKQARDRVYALVDAVAALLTADPTLGGIVGRTHLSTHVLGQQQNAKGAMAMLRFEIQIDAFTR